MLSDPVKIIILLFLYFGFAPFLGIFIRSNRTLQKVVFAMMVFFTVLKYRIISINPYLPSPEAGLFFHGHTWGFECTAMDVMAIALLFTGRDPTKKVSWFPPGLLLWVLFCAASSLSIVNAPQPFLVVMATFKFFKVSVVYIATYHFIRKEEDIHFLFKTFAWLLLFQGMVCIIQRYLFGVYQVPALFDHQNSLVMYSYMTGLPLLAAALSKTKRNRFYLYLSGFIASGLATLFSLSRMGVLCFGAGSILVIFLSLVDGFSRRRILVTIFMFLASIAVLAKAANTLMGRFTADVNIPSKMTRDVLNRASRQMLTDYPFFGGGWNNYGVLINRPFRYGAGFEEWEADEGYNSTYSENAYRPISESWYYLMLAENGFVGTGFCFIFFLTTLYWCGRAMFFYRHTFLGSVSMGLFCGLGMNYVQSNTEHVLYQPKNLVMWFICLATVAKLHWWRLHWKKQRPR